jgi:glutamate 5-kinase
MKYKRIIVKIGTSTLTSGTSAISLPRLVQVVQQIADMQTDGIQVILVTSGGIAAGREALDFPDFPKFVPSKQMLSSIGQPRLMSIYTELFKLYGKTVSQILLTRSDLSDRRRYLNARNTLEALLQYGVIPVINENDTVATEEIRFGDNDNLSALVANLIDADLLILLTDQEGIYSSDPRVDRDAKLIPLVSTTDIPEELWKAAGGSKSSLGTGGMHTKLEAADLARRSGTAVVVANGETPGILQHIANHEKVGTFFTAVASTVESRKRYILAGAQSAAGRIIIDKGAAKALIKGGSLLPVGIVNTIGEFERGDTVHIIDPNQTAIALGTTNYSSIDLAQIRRHQSTEIEGILGYTFGQEVIHHNNMLLL